MIGSLWRVLPGGTKDPPPILYGGDYNGDGTPYTRARGDVGETILVLSDDELFVGEACYNTFTSGHGVRRVYASWFDGKSMSRMDGETR